MILVIILSALFFLLAIKESEELGTYIRLSDWLWDAIDTIFGKACIFYMAVAATFTSTLDGNNIWIYLLTYTVAFIISEVPGRMLSPAIIGSDQGDGKHPIFNKVTDLLVGSDPRSFMWGTVWLTLRGLLAAPIFFIGATTVLSPLSYTIIYAVASGSIPFICGRMCAVVDKRFFKTKIVAMRYPWWIARIILGALMGALLSW